MNLKAMEEKDPRNAVQFDHLYAISAASEEERSNLMMNKSFFERQPTLDQCLTEIRHLKKLLYTNMSLISKQNEANLAKERKILVYSSELVQLKKKVLLLERKCKAVNSSMNPPPLIHLPPQIPSGKETISSREYRAKGRNTSAGGITIRNPETINKTFEYSSPGTSSSRFGDIDYSKMLNCTKTSYDVPETAKSYLRVKNTGMSRNLECTETSYTKKKLLSGLDTDADELMDATTNDPYNYSDSTVYFSPTWKINQPKKLETSCSDFSYGESINQFGSSLLTNKAQTTSKSRSLCMGNGRKMFFGSSVKNVKRSTNTNDFTFGESTVTSVKKQYSSFLPGSSRMHTETQKEKKNINLPRAPIDDFMQVDSEDTFSDLNRYQHDSDNPISFGNLFLTEEGPNAMTTSREDNDCPIEELTPSVLSADDSSYIDACDENQTNSLTSQRRNSYQEKAGRRKRTQSTCSRISTYSQPESTSSNPWAYPTSKPTMMLNNKPLSILSVPDAYFTIAGEITEVPKMAEPEPVSEPLEVPKWRESVLTYSDTYTDDYENLDDSVFLKRHFKMEMDERRIKRWDFQRLKEQSLLKKLKERQEKINSGGKRFLYRSYRSSKEVPPSLWPAHEDVLYIEIGDLLPVAGFGESLPDFDKRHFHLPWLRTHETKSRRPKKMEKECD